MNETHATIIATWIAMFLAAYMHWRGVQIRSFGFMRSADITMVAVVFVLSAVAWNHDLPIPRIFSVAKANQDMSFPVSLLARNMDDKPQMLKISPDWEQPEFIGEVGGHLYHHPGCERFLDLKQPVAILKFHSEGAAKASGRSGCIDCVGYPK